MAQPKKQLRTFHDHLRIIEEVEKNPGEKHVYIAKWLGLAASTLNSIFAKMDGIRQQIEKCGNACKKRKNGKESTFAELETVLFTWYQQTRASNIPIDGTTLREKVKIIATQLNIDNFSASNGWVNRFKDWRGLVFKKLAGESVEVSVEGTDAWLESLPSLLGFMNHAMYTMQTRWGYSSTCFLIEPWRIKESLAMVENVPKTDSLCYYVLIVMEVTNKCRLWWEVPETKVLQER